LGLRDLFWGELYLYLNADDISILGGSVHTVEKSAENLVVASKETGLEVNADKSQYMVTSGDQNVGRSHSIKIDNTSFERVEEFKYLGTALRNQNCSEEELKAD